MSYRRPGRQRLLQWVCIGLAAVFLILGRVIPSHAQTSNSCAITPDKLDGQGLNVTGFGLSVTQLGLSVTQLGLNVTGFGLSVTQFGLNVTQFGTVEQIIQDMIANTATPQWLLNLLPSIEGGVGYNSMPTAILIVDDFTGTHGPEVKKVLDDLLAALNAVSNPDPQILLVPVNMVGDFNTPFIAQQIRTTVANLRAQGYQRFAINMSFGLVPCADPGGVTLVDETGATFVAPPFNFTQFTNAVQQAVGAQNKAVMPLLNCVYNRGGGNFTAYFGYQNDNTAPVSIPIGKNNQFHPSPADRGQPALFMPGRHEYVFKVDFKGSQRQWTIRAPDGRTYTATASDSPHTKCKTEPILKPVQVGAGGFGLSRYATEKLGVPPLLVDEYIEYLADKGDDADALNGLKPLLQEYLQLSNAHATDGNPATNFAVIPVAASGNFRHLLGSNPLAPARYVETIATGATLGNFGPRWVLSHDGNMLAPGAGVILAQDAAGTVTKIGAGTSYAAPYVSLLSALWLTYPNACSFAGNLPPLAYDPLSAAAKHMNAIANGNGTGVSPLNCRKNLPPTLTPNGGSVTVNEGQTASRSGQVSDPDGDPVTLWASVGTVTLNGNQWNWSYPTTDGPAQSQTVTITASDNFGGSAQISFTLVVNNVPPTATFTASPQSATTGQTVTLSLLNAADVSQPDQAAGFNYTFDCGAGAGVQNAPGNTFACTYASAGPYTAVGTIRDKDGGTTTYSLAVTISAAPQPPSTCYATSVLSYVPGTRKDGSPLPAAVKDPNKALGPEQNDNTLNYVTLGFGNQSTTGVIILSFGPKKILNQNGSAPDLRVWETSAGSYGGSTLAGSTYSFGGETSSYPETARVEASKDGVTWVVVGYVTSSSPMVNLGSLPWAKYIKLVDVTDRKSKKSDVDGFDLDAVQGLNCGG